MIKMQVPSSRGGNGDWYERVAHTDGILWDPVEPSPKKSKQDGEEPWELENGFDWSEPQLEPEASRFAGRWASHAVVKGVINLPQSTSPTFYSRTGDLQIYSSIDVMFFYQARYMTITVPKVTRDLSLPLQEDAPISNDNQPPPYTT